MLALKIYNHYTDQDEVVPVGDLDALYAFAHQMGVNPEVYENLPLHDAARAIAEYLDNHHLEADVVDSVTHEPLAKSRPALQFPHFTQKWTRPDQEIQNIDTDQQRQMAVSKLAGPLDYEGEAKQLAHEWVFKQLQPRKAQAELYAANKKRQDVDVKPEEVQVAGFVGQSLSGPARPMGFVSNEAGSGKNTTRAHEGIHWLIYKIANEHDSDDNYASDIEHRIYSHLNSVIPEDLHEHLGAFLSKQGYTPEQMAKEKAPWLYNILTVPSTRNVFLMNVPKEQHQEMITKAKQTWDKIVDVARNLTPKDVTWSQF